MPDFYFILTKKVVHRFDIDIDSFKKPQQLFYY